MPIPDQGHEHEGEKNSHDESRHQKTFDVSRNISPHGLFSRWVAAGSRGSTRVHDKTGANATPLFFAGLRVLDLELAGILATTRRGIFLTANREVEFVSSRGTRHRQTSLQNFFT